MHFPYKHAILLSSGSSNLTVTVMSLVLDKRAKKIF